MAWSPAQSACPWCMIHQTPGSRNGLVAPLLVEMGIGFQGHDVYIESLCNFQGLRHHAQYQHVLPRLWSATSCIRNSWEAFSALEDIKWIYAAVWSCWFDSIYKTKTILYGLPYLMRPICAPVLHWASGYNSFFLLFFGKNFHYNSGRYWDE